MILQSKIESAFSRIYSDKVLKTVEKYILYLASIGFIIHLLIIFLKKLWIYRLKPYRFKITIKSYLSFIYSFSFILIYEAYLLIFYIPRSFTTAIGKQFEIISLIVIRKIFGDIPLINLQSNWFDNQYNLQLIYDLVGIIVIFFLIYLFRKAKDNLPKKPVSEKLDRFIASKKLLSITLLPILIAICVLSFYNWISTSLITNTFDQDLNYLFFNEFFTLLIVVDVFILLISFQYTERYSQLIRNTGFIISTILLRLSFSAVGLSSILLIISGILFGLLILVIYNEMEKEPSNS